MKFIFLLSFIGLVFSRTQLSSKLSNLGEKLIQHYDPSLHHAGICTIYLKHQCDYFPGFGNLFGFDCQKPGDACPELVTYAQNICKDLVGHLSGEGGVSSSFESLFKGLDGPDKCRFLAEMCDHLSKHCNELHRRVEAVCTSLYIVCSGNLNEEDSLRNLITVSGSDIYDPQKCRSLVHKECRSVLLNSTSLFGDPKYMVSLCGSNGDKEDDYICRRIVGQADMLCSVSAIQYLFDGIIFRGQLDNLVSKIEEYKTLVSGKGTKSDATQLLKKLEGEIISLYNYMHYHCRISQPCDYLPFCQKLQADCHAVTQVCGRLEEIRKELPLSS